MENSKLAEPKFSSTFKDLAYYFASLRKSLADGTSFNLSRISKGDFETSSQFTGINNAFGSMFGPGLGSNHLEPGSAKGLNKNILKKEGSMHSEINSNSLNFLGVTQDVGAISGLSQPNKLKQVSGAGTNSLNSILKKNNQEPAQLLGGGILLPKEDFRQKT